MKLQVLVNDSVCKRIDKLADFIGCSRSSICATIIVKALPEWESYLNEEVSQEDLQSIDQLQFDIKE